MFSVRIVTFNYYQTSPIEDLDVTFSEFRGSEVKQVPVIRVFGSTPSGQKTCLHVHGVFPYIYIPYDGSQPTDRYLHQMASSLDTALQVAQGKASSSVQHVFKISLVSGIPLYGYHKSERQFMKIYFYNPAVRKRAVELLQNGAVMNKIFQPHESHVPFNLQFLIDYNLYGMNMLNLAAVKFRKSEEVTDSANQKPSSPKPSTSFQDTSLPGAPTPLRRRHSSGSMSICTQVWADENIPSSQWLGEDIKRQSSCELEVDAVAADILNRMDLQDNAETNPGLVGIWEDERQRREQLDQMDQLLPPSSPERGEISLFSAEENWRTRLEEIVEKQVKDLQEMESQVISSEDEPMDIDNSQEDISPSQLSIPCTPANEVEYHYSQNPDSEPSQRQTFSGDVAPVVNEELVQSILEASQRLSQSQAQDTCDEELANLLVDLVHEEEEEDLVLSGRRSTQSSRGNPRPSGIDISDSDDEDSPELEAQEEKEMSQAWIGLDDELEEADNSAHLDNLISEIEDGGGDASQKSTQRSDVIIPQLDGSSDVKPGEGEKKNKSKSLLGSGRGGAKSPRKQDGDAEPERPLAADKIARNPHMTVVGPLGEISDALLALEESPKKKSRSRKRKGLSLSSRSPRGPRKLLNGKKDEAFPVFERAGKVQRRRTSNSRSTVKRAKRILQLDDKVEESADNSMPKPLVSLGRGRMGNKSPRMSSEKEASPFFAEKVSRSPQKPLQGPLEKYSNAIEYNIAPCFQYAESLKPKDYKKSLQQGNTSPRPMDTKKRRNRQPSANEKHSKTSPRQTKHTAESQSPRLRRNSSKAEDDETSPSSRRRRHSMKEESSKQRSSGTNSHGARVGRTNSEVSPRKRASQEFTRLQSVSSDEDFKESKPHASFRRGNAASKDTRKKVETGKATRKMAKGKRSNNSYRQIPDSPDVVEGSPVSNPKEKSRSPGKHGIGRGGKRSPRSQQQQSDTPFISDRLIRSPHKPMEGPVSVYSNSIGYKIAPLFQYAESVKPKPKVVLTPLEIPTHSPSKSPNILKRSDSIAISASEKSPKMPANVVRRRSVPAGSSPDKLITSPSKSPKAQRSILLDMSSKSPGKYSNRNKDKVAKRSRPTTKAEVKVSPKQKRSRQENSVSNMELDSPEQSQSLLLGQSFVFDGKMTSPAKIGRGHMGQKSPRRLKEMEDKGSPVLSSKQFGRSPLKAIRDLSGKLVKLPFSDYQDLDLAEFKIEKSQQGKKKNVSDKSKEVKHKQAKQEAGTSSKEQHSKDEKGSKKTALQRDANAGQKKKKDKNLDGGSKKNKKEKEPEVKPVKKSRKPSTLKFDPVTMPSVRLRVTTWPKLKACKELNPNLILKKLCLDEASWDEVVRNALYRDLDRLSKRKISQGDDENLNTKRTKNGINAPWGRGPASSSPRKEQMKAIMAAKEGKDIYKRLKGAGPRRRARSKIEDIYGGGPDNKVWNFVPPITPPDDEITKNPIPEISELSKDESRDVMWRLACYSPQHPENISSPPRCWSPLSKISDVEAEYEDDDYIDEEQGVEPLKGEDGGKEEVTVTVPTSDNEMDIIERNLGQISDFSVYEKMLGGTTAGRSLQQETKTNNEEFALEHFQEDVSGIYNHLHGDSEKDAISDEFAKLDNSAHNSHVNIKNRIPSQQGGQVSDLQRQINKVNGNHHTTKAQVHHHVASSQSQHTGRGIESQPRHSIPHSTPLLPQNNVNMQAASQSNSEGSGSNSSSQITPGQKTPTFSAETNSGSSSSYTAHSPRGIERRTSSSSQFTVHSQGMTSQTPGSQEPTTIPETDSEHSSGSPPQNQYNSSQPTQIASQGSQSKEPIVHPGNSTNNQSMYYHGASHASQSMYEMSNHSFNQSTAYGNDRVSNQSQGFSQSHLPPYPSPGSNQSHGYPPPYPSPQSSYPNPPPQSPNHQSQPSGSQSPAYRVPYQPGPQQHPYQDTNGSSVPAAKPKIWRPVAMPPTDTMVRKSLQEYGLPEVHHQGAYWGNPQDHAGRQREGLGQAHVQTMLPSSLQPADTPCGTMGLNHWQTVVQSQGETPSSQGYSTSNQGYNCDAVWMPSKYPPPRASVTGWLNNKQQGEQTHGIRHDNGSGMPGYQQNPEHSQHAVTLPHNSPGQTSTPFLPQQHNGTLHNQNNQFTTLQGQQANSLSDNHSNAHHLPGSGHQPVVPPQGTSPMQSGAYPVQPSTQQVATPRQQPLQATQPLSVPVTSCGSSNGLTAQDQNYSSSATNSNNLERTPGVKQNTQPIQGSSMNTPVAGIPKGVQSCTPPLSSTPLRPLARTSVMSQEQPGVTPIAIQKPTPLMDLTKLKNPSYPNTPAQVTPDVGMRRKRSLVSQIEGPTPKNTYGFKVSQGNSQDAKALHVVQHLTTMSLEVHVRTRRDYHPDPDFDPIRAIFYCIHKDGPDNKTPPSNHHHGDAEDGSKDISDEGHSSVGVIMVDLSKKGSKSEEGAGGITTDLNAVTQRDWMTRSGVMGLEVTYVEDEKEMFEEFVKLVRRHDPDMLAGFEIQQLSWGYLFQRAAFLEVQLCQLISRLPDETRESHFSADKDAYGADHMSEITVAGRIVLNLWRIIRHEVTLNIYTFENVAYHVLHQRLPLFTFRSLTDWFDHNTACYRWRTIEYYAERVKGNVQLIKKLDLIGRTSELARLFGIEFYSVLSRGSQYRVESMMLRQAKCANYIAVSPSVQQRSRSKAPECIALVMEPESRFYEDPVIVLDFQSLYPSMMIAYNYCFSTCLGRVEHIAQGGEYSLGCHSLSIPPKQLDQLLASDGIHVSPNGVAYVKHSVRHGVLPRMLDQILNTRIMVKKALKDHKGDKVLEKMLDNRQLGLKLIANVTYGYTSANFSGRMPCIEVGDSVVRKGRETLERAIKMVETTAKWGARVVYGDTDSLFVLVKGATKERAFEIGREIVAAVTAENPKPVKLKLEKVYKPCVLQAKKRYVGYKYESPDQKDPEFDAKGIETVRRDSCPAVAKILERSLKILFETKDVSKVKRYVQQQFQKLNAGQIGLQDLIFAKEYRGRQYYKPTSCVPALEIAKRKLAVDRRSEPRVSERVPYVVVHGSPGLPLIQLVRTPQDYLQDPSYNLNAPYYITRQIIPALNRVFGMMAVDTLEWYQELPKVVHINTVPNKGSANTRKGTISQYFCSLNCAVCDRLTQSGLCDSCRSSPQTTVTSLMKRIQDWDRERTQINKICTSCCGFADNKQHCTTLDCPIRFQLVKSEHKMEKVEHFLSLVQSIEPSST
nr:DNA polymerase zeta catalytic subunit-like [Lytechinus pictus]